MTKEPDNFSLKIAEIYGQVFAALASANRALTQSASTDILVKKSARALVLGVARHRQA
jgi:hypothetical protein